MFSGIVECTGHISQIKIAGGCKHFTITPAMDFDDIEVGASIAINGVCLTVTQFSETDFHVTAVPETLQLTNLAELKTGDTVNLERSIKINGRLGGHFVQGHVDAMGQVMAISHENSDACIVKISIPEKLSQYIVPKGYITLDGMSITIIETTANWFTVTFIPHTQQVSLAGQYSIGSKINLEVDILGKYVEKMLGGFKHVISH